MSVTLTPRRDAASARKVGQNPVLRSGLKDTQGLAVGVVVAEVVEVVVVLIVVVAAVVLVVITVVVVVAAVVVVMIRI